MWRSTYESIGKPLPRRRNIVLSRTQKFPEVECYDNIEEILWILENELADTDEVFVIGWASLYEYFMDKAEWLYLTEIKRTVKWDTFFPVFDDHFEEAEREIYDDELDFVIYRKKRTE